MRVEDGRGYLASWVEVCHRSLPDDILSQIEDANGLDEEVIRLALDAAQELAEGFLALIDQAFDEAAEAIKT